ncbi:MAG: ABC transporter family substrate-binding protein [Pseudonocardiaceae bacterium]|nr:ABC transporter family substrate-binding protein [Pseudonocardiaceae bacterium]
MQKLRGLSASAVALAFALVVSACTGGGNTAGGEVPDRGRTAGASATGDNGDGTYNIPESPAGPAVFVAHPTPYTSYNSTTAGADTVGNAVVLNQVLADPFVRDPNGDYLLNADVMQSVTLTSEDPQVVTYKIKPGIRWSDGEAWDCDDFYLAWLAGSGRAVMRDSEGEPVTDPAGDPRTHFDAASTVGTERATGECIDNLTFVETYDAPFADWRGNYARNAILPAHILEREAGIPDITQLTPESAPARLQRAADFWNNGWTGFDEAVMLASGPYQIASREPNRSVTLTRNESWSANRGGPERIVLVGMPDGGAAAAALADQEVNVVTPRADPVVADQLRRLADQGVVLEVRGGTTTEHLDLGFDNPLFQDPAVRAAFFQCVDRNDLVNQLARRIDPQAQPLGSLMFLPDEPEYAEVYSETGVGDAERAKHLLEAAGWTLGPDNVYAKDGRQLSFRISHTVSPRQAQIVELIQLHCREAGIEVIDDPDPAFLDERLPRGDFDAALLATRRPPLKSSLASLYQTTGARNHLSYSNPEVDKALEIVQIENNEAARMDALASADRAMAEDDVSLPLFQVPDMWAYSDNIEGIHPHGWAGVTWNAAEWEVD